MDKNKKSNKPNELSLKSFGKSFVEEVFYLDGRIAKTLKVLFLNPGQLTLTYINSSENRYLKPLKLYLIINFIFFLITPILNTPNFQVFSFSLESLSGKNQVYKNMIEKEIQTMNIPEEIYEERFNA
ncbi:MAG: DUF3667 domain-containing protein, partial [Bacteroidales bacterium]|nr:DUF3667 domain-containing protein [Bacteroidales bacterium]